MDKIQIVLDTSAIISLGCTEKFHLIKKIFHLNSPMRVKIELEEISKRKDEIGKVAKNILDSNFITFHELPSNLQNIKGEVEVGNLANELKTEAIVTDDIKSMRKLEKTTNTPIWFSSFIIYLLCERQLISHKEGWSAIEAMRTKRGWKENLIIDYAKILWEKQKEILK